MLRKAYLFRELLVLMHALSASLAVFHAGRRSKARSPRSGEPGVNSDWTVASMMMRQKTLQATAVVALPKAYREQ